MTQVFDGTRFPLLDTLRSVQSVRLGKEFETYSEAIVPGVDRDQLAYFSLSVFWRASVHVWRLFGTGTDYD